MNLQRLIVAGGSDTNGDDLRTTEASPLIQGPLVANPAPKNENPHMLNFTIWFLQYLLGGSTYQWENFKMVFLKSTLQFLVAFCFLNTNM